MISLITGPLGKIAGIALLIAALWGGFKVWLISHDRAVLAGYVLLSEKTTAEAAAKEAKRQADIATQSAEEYHKKLVTIQMQDAQNDIAREAEIKDYEQKLAAANRACLLDSTDIGILQHNGTGKAAPVGKHKGPH